MALTIQIDRGNAWLTEAARRRIRRRLGHLERRLAHHPDPVASLTLTEHFAERQVEVDVRVALGPHGRHLVSHQRAENADLAVRLAVDDVERQLERTHARMRREHTYGVPSRRFPPHVGPDVPPRAAPAAPTLPAAPKAAA